MAEALRPPVAVITLPLELSHRHSDFVDLRPIADRWAVPVVELANSNSPEALAMIEEMKPDIIFVIGWSQICGDAFLSIPRVGSVGYHPSRLPENRGRAVIPWTILQGASETGSTLFWLGQGMDDGDIIAQRRFPVAEDETAESLTLKHRAALEEMLTELFQHVKASDIPATQQDHSLASFCAKRTAADGLIDWGLGAREVWRFVRAVGRPYPGAFTYWEGRRVTVWSASYVGPRPVWAQAGQVVEASPEGWLVQCGDREHVLVTEYELEETNPSRRVPVGAKFCGSPQGETP